MKNKFLPIVLSSVLLAGCGLLTNFDEFSNKLGVSMPSKYEKLFHGGESAIDSSLHYDIYSVKEEWKLEYQTQYQTDFEEPFELDKYIDAINGYEPLNIPEERYIPHSSSLDWVCKREAGKTRNYEWLLIFDSSTKMLYALDSTHQWFHQGIL
ncbi:MAG: hypothetical protein IKP56_02305 [Bacilli bacterium]|nr:hypothetical protein [Bacilli bacterium]